MYTVGYAASAQDLHVSKDRANRGTLLVTISTLILTLNEEVNLPKCLDSLSWCDDIVVFDSFSTDRTVDIARSRGARVFQHRFDNYGAQREAARTLVDYQYPWVLTVDADERVEPALIEEMRAIAAEDGRGHSAYRMRRKDHFMGRWIPHATLYPTWFVRLYRNESIWYSERTVHEHPEVKGTVGVLEGHLLHYSFNKGFADWLQKHKRYASLEAEEGLRSLLENRVDWGGVSKLSDPRERRKFLKVLSYRMPCRPALRFFYMYLIRRGILDGIPGATYCTLLSLYEYLIVINMKQMRRSSHGDPVGIPGVKKGRL